MRDLTYKRMRRGECALQVDTSKAAIINFIPLFIAKLKKNTCCVEPLYTKTAADASEHHTRCSTPVITAHAGCMPPIIFSFLPNQKQVLREWMIERKRASIFPPYAPRLRMHLATCSPIRHCICLARIACLHHCLRVHVDDEID